MRLPKRRERPARRVELAHGTLRHVVDHTVTHVHQPRPKPVGVLLRVEDDTGRQLGMWHAGWNGQRVDLPAWVLEQASDVGPGACLHLVVAWDER